VIYDLRFTIYALLACLGCLTGWAGSLPVERQAAFFGPPPIGSGGGGGGTCPADGSPTITQAGTAAFLDNNSSSPYVGMVYTNGPTSTNLCKVRFNFTAKTDIAGSTFTVRLYALSGTAITAASPIAETASVNGDGAWSLTDVIFTFASPPTMSANTLYAIVATANGGTGTGQYAQLNRGTTTISGRAAGWFSDGTIFDPQDGTSPTCALYMY
jgi:hypothetical protein